MGEERIDEKSVFRQVEAILSCLNIDKDVYKSCEMVGQTQELNVRLSPGSGQSLRAITAMDVLVFSSKFFLLFSAYIQLSLRT